VSPCLLGPYHQHAIGTFNTCSQGPTHQSLTDSGGGYNLGDADIRYLTQGATSLIKTSSNSKWILNLKSWKILWFEIQWNFLGKSWDFGFLMKFD
jgi:hypothetical protein